MGEPSRNLTETPQDGALSRDRKGVIEASAVWMRRTMNADAFNRIANHPDVRPWLGGDGELVLDGLVSDPTNHSLLMDGKPGGFLLVARGGGAYEVHSLFEPEARRYSLQAMREGMRYMFCETDAFRLVTQVLDSNAAAAALAKKGGFREWFRREQTPLGPSSYMVIELDEWVQRDHSNAAAGAWFHDRLAEAKAASGSTLPTHPDDDAHDLAVGAAVRMIQLGNAAKGVGVYNRWAAAAGYAQIDLLSLNPVVIDVRDAVVQLNGDGTMEMLRCL